MNQENTLDTELYIKFREETDPILKFNLFLELYCPDDYAHLIDSDDNGGEFMRQAIAQATQKAEVRGLSKAHDIFYPYEPKEPCPYCMGEAHSVEHETLIDLTKELQSEGEL